MSSAGAMTNQSNLRGITGGDVRGITGGGGRGITGGGGRGITGGGGRGITGGGGRGITGGGGRGITGGGGRGITGGGGRGITGGGGRGITGGGGRGITGGGGRGITGGGGRGITGGGGRGITGGGGRGLIPPGAGLSAVGSAAMGPVEALAVSGDSVTLTVLGQSFKTDAARASSVREGDYVVVAADVAGNVAVLDSIGSSYVPGASPVGVLGQVAAVDPSVGTMAVGALTVDYTAHLASDPTYVPRAGDLVEAYGVQPAQLGQVILQ